MTDLEAQVALKVMTSACSSHVAVYVNGGGGTSYRVGFAQDPNRPELWNAKAWRVGDPTPIMTWSAADLGTLSQRVVELLEVVEVW